MYPWQSFILGLCEHLAWPSFAFFCIVYFQKDIRNLLSRIKTLPGGTELNPETIQEQKEAKKEFNIILRDWTQKKEDETTSQKIKKESK